MRTKGAISKGGSSFLCIVRKRIVCRNVDCSFYRSSNFGLDNAASEAA